MYLFSEFTGGFANVALAVLFLNNLFHRRPTPSWQFAGYFLLFTLGQCVLGLMPSWVLPRTIYFILVGSVFACSFYQVSVLQASFTIVAYFTLGAVVETFLLTLLILCGIDSTLLMQRGSTRWAYVTASGLTQIPFIFLISLVIKRKSASLDALQLLPLLLIQGLSLVVCYWVMNHEMSLDFPPYWAAVIFVLFIINLIIAFYAEVVRACAETSAQAILKAKQYELQQEYYSQLKESQEKTRALWHDIKKYILAMEVAANEASAEEVQYIVTQAKKAFESANNISVVGNPVVDAILNNYIYCAKKHRIEYTQEIHIPDHLALDSLILSIVIGNTFDNAIEACSVLPFSQRFIKVLMRKQGHIFFYKIENSYAADCPVVKKDYHGYGLPNVERAVKSHGGVIQINKNEQTFTVCVRIMCKS